MYNDTKIYFITKVINYEIFYLGIKKRSHYYGHGYNDWYKDLKNARIFTTISAAKQTANYIKEKVIITYADIGVLEK